MDTQARVDWTARTKEHAEESTQPGLHARRCRPSKKKEEEMITIVR